MQSSRWRFAHNFFYLAAAGSLVLLSLLGVELPERVQLWCLVLLVALVGIPHGALDPLVAYSSGLACNRSEMCRFLGVYVLQATAMVAAWCILPVLAFVLFLLISIHHFAGDWIDDLPVWSRLATAATIITAPPLFHPRETAEIFAVLVPAAAVPQIMMGLKLLAFVAIGLMIPGMLIAVRHAWRSAAEMLSLPILAWALPPLAFFVVYFCGLHSPRHFLETLDQLSVRSDILWWVTIGITFLTLSVCVIAFFMLPSAAVSGRLLQIVFIGLAALTVPHMLLIEKVRLRAGRMG